MRGLGGVEVGRAGREKSKGEASTEDLGEVGEETDGDAKGGGGFEVFPTLLTRFNIDVRAFNSWPW